MLRGQMVRHAPMLCMTATATDHEIKEVKDIMGFRDANTVELVANPVQSQFNFVRVERPPNVRGTCGTEEFDGCTKAGLIHVLRRVFF